MFDTLSNQLTFARLVAIPILCLLLVVPGSISAWFAMFVFVGAAITDYFDGYYARKRAELTTLGRVLDPIADKLLVVATLVILVFNEHVNALTIVPALIIILREVAISGLREFMAERSLVIAVSKLAKWKTGVQMTAIPFLIVGDYAPSFIPAIWIGALLLWAAAVLTVITAWDYWRASEEHIM